ncbi:MAG: hypothetical protein Ta2B_14340 [Termitinemataceae bacterium]|nr:MAG: hypothetical protein Ta2B_14340 [Termitinemataceae bacterium]
MNKPISYSDFSYIAKTLLAQDWIFAKTMPANPHHYALRKNFKTDERFANDSDSLFDFIVAAMRECSYSGKFGGRRYQYFNVNEHYYWTMGAPIKETILINRKLRGPVPYDEIASKYNDLFTDAGSLKENDDVLNMINYQGGSLLEIGCASCPLIERLEVSEYYGIDPSGKMIEICRRNNPNAVFVQSDFEAFYTPNHFDYIVATFGAASYIDENYLQRINEMLNPGGKIFLMFYKDDYLPATYQKTGMFLDWHKGNYKAFNGEMRSYNNYFVLSKGQ